MDRADDPAHVLATPRPRRRLVALVVVTLLLGTGCGDDGDSPEPAPSSSSGSGGAGAEGPVSTPLTAMLRRLATIVTRSGGRLVLMPLGAATDQLRPGFSARGVTVVRTAGGAPVDLARGLEGADPNGVMAAVPEGTDVVVPDGVDVFRSDHPLGGLYRILSSIGSGRRPSCAVWVLDVAALVGVSVPLDELATTETALDVSHGLHEVPVGARFFPHLGVGDRTEGPEILRFAAADDEVTLALDRGNLQGSHLVLYLKRTGGAATPAWMKLRDELADRAPRRSRFPLFPSKSWQRVPLPVPWGQHKILLTLRDVAIGERWELQRPGLVFLHQAPWDGERVVYRPTTWRVVGVDGGRAEAQDTVTLEVGKAACVGAAVSTATRFTFSPPPPPGAQVSFAFGTLQQPEPDRSVPVVVTISQSVSGADRVLYQKEYWTEPGSYSADSALLCVPKAATATPLVIRVSKPRAIAGHSATAVAFAEKLR